MSDNEKAIGFWDIALGVLFFATFVGLIAWVILSNGNYGVTYD